MHRLGHPSQDFPIVTWEIFFITVIMEKSIHISTYHFYHLLNSNTATHQTLVRSDFMYSMHRVVLAEEVLDKYYHHYYLYP